MPLEISLLDFVRLDRSAVVSFRSSSAFGPISEKLIQAFYEQVLSEGDTAVDIGVHYGRHLFPMRDCVGRTGLVYGVEANAERYIAMLKRIAKKNLTNVHLINVAASDKDDYCDFYVNKSHSGRSGLRNNKLSALDDVQKIGVHTAPLSVILPRSLRPRLMKLDIEGAEFCALLGAQAVIERSNAIVVFEGNLARTALDFGFSAVTVEGYIRRIGYAVFDLFGNAIDLATGNGGFGWNFVMGLNDEPTRGLIGRALTAAWANVLTQGNA
jgi:FkbM family methyltransferase